MVFHAFGDKENRAVMLIHGALTPWRMWEDAIARFSREYYVVAPELSAHTGREASRFLSVEDEARQIKEYIQTSLNGRVYALCGLSMGGRVAATLAGERDISIQNLVLDGAPLTGLPRVLTWFMKRGYLDIIRKSRKRDPGVIRRFKTSFLPEKYLEDYLQIADHMEDASVKNMLDSVSGEFAFTKYSEDMRILFMHGVGAGELASRKSAKKMRSVNPQTVIRRFDGRAHAALACFDQPGWIDAVAGFLEAPG